MSFRKYLIVSRLVNKNEVFECLADRYFIIFQKDLDCFVKKKLRTKSFEFNSII